VANADSEYFLRDSKNVKDVLVFPPAAFEVFLGLLKRD
jgi:hypothetical protein